MAENDFDYVPMTQQNTNVSPTTYLWVILFLWELNEEFPFSVVPLHLFTKDDFPMDLITGPLPDQERVKPRELTKLLSKKYSVFAKIEKGAFLNDKKKYYK